MPPSKASNAAEPDTATDKTTSGRQKAPSVKVPCLQCKEKHVKCDEQRPRCHRCIQKDLPCDRPTKQTVFRHEATAGKFSQSQEWVNSEPKRLRFHLNSAAPADDEMSDFDTPSPADKPTKRKKASSSKSNAGQHNGQSTFAVLPPPAPPFNPPVAAPMGRSAVPSIAYLTSQAPYMPNINNLQDYTQSVPPPRILDFSKPPALALDDEYRSFPLQDVQEACLLRYFIDEISQWFDLCDEARHFQLVVPQYAKRHPHLLNAIFAVSARHLARLPKYRTARGIMYHGQLLPHLSPHHAVEYMLKCIPAFRKFHETFDDDYRDSIVATAVILRQLEEIDDEEDEIQEAFDMLTGPTSGPGSKKVNFLGIINAVLQDETMHSAIGQSSMVQAAYWMALRQEIYHSFTRREPPQLSLASEHWTTASNVNKTVMHTVQVAKWHWGGGGDDEWLQLMDRQVYIEEYILGQQQPFFQRVADKAKGEIFPTVWYASNFEVTAAQQAIMSRSILIAENPFLKSQPTSRHNWRSIENEVRLLMLDLCGISLCHSECAPALVNAGIGMQVYGEFFTDHYERAALRGVAEKYADARAWPVQKLLDMFQ